MKVRARLVSEDGKEGRVVGYYGNRRIREGEVFEIVTIKGKDREGNIVTRKPEDQFSKKWMERIDQKIIKKVTVEETPEPDNSSLADDAVI